MNAEYFDLLRRLSQPIRAAALPHTLDHVVRLLEALGNPQTRFPSVVVAGSTGKGTTCLRLADWLSVTGRKVGLYTSPHLHSFLERMVIVEPWQVNPIRRGTPCRITQPEFVEHARAVLAAEAALETRYSTFESATVLALLWFAQQQVDVAVLEIGIGGRFDAVNAVTNVLAVFTPIEAEHVAMLGGSVESVAWHKAGIIQPNGWAVTVSQSPQVMAVLEREAAEKNATLQVGTDPVEVIAPGGFPNPPFPVVRGQSQQNLFDATASPVGSEPTSVGFPTEPLAGGFEPPVAQPSISLEKRNVFLPGRLERITINGHSVVIDGGHTPAAAHHLREYIEETASVRLIVGMLRDKNVAAYLSTFDAPNVHFVYAQAPGDRALTSAELLERFRPTHASVTLADSLNEVLASVTDTPESLIVVAGSLRMAAAAREAFGLLTPDALEEARLTRAIFEGEEYQGKLSAVSSQQPAKDESG